MNEEQSKIRKSLEEVSSPEEIDQLLYLVQPRLWHPVIAVFVIIVIALIWSFLGRIPTEVNGRGVTLTPKGVFSIISQANGTVTDVGIKGGDSVEEGTYIATIFTPQYSALLSKIGSEKFKISQTEAEIVMLQARLVSREKLHQEGLVARTVVEDTQSQLFAKEIALKEAKSALDSLISDLVEASASGDRLIVHELMSRPLTGEDIKHWEKELARVYAPSSGRVLEILVKVDDIVAEKQPLVWMEHPQDEDTQTVFQSYISVQEGNKVRPGMKARIEPTIVNPQEYGSINGVVKSVSSFAISEEELLNTLRNKQLVGYLTEGSAAVIQVEVEPVVDNGNPSGFSWTSGDGPPYKIPTGTVNKISIVVEEQPPISFLIPLWKLKPQY